MDRPNGQDPYFSRVLVPLTIAALAMAVALLLVHGRNGSTGVAVIILRIAGIVFFASYIVVVMGYVRRTRGRRSGR